MIYFEALIEKYHPTGIYTLFLKHNTTVLHSLSITLANYDKPDIQISIQAPQWRLLGEPINCTIQAKYYHGEPVRKAAITITTTSWKEPFNCMLENGFFIGELPGLESGDWTLEIAIHDEAGRETKTTHRIKIVEEPLKLSYITNPEERPFVEKQPLEIILKTNDPLDKPLSELKFVCSLKDDNNTEYLLLKEYITSHKGVIKISLPELKTGN